MCVCVVVYILTVLFPAIFHGAVDRLTWKCLCMLNHMIMWKFIMESEAFSVAADRLKRECLCMLDRMSMCEM